jgi:hypothetical protein
VHGATRACGLRRIASCGTMCVVVPHAPSLIFPVGLCTHRNQKLFSLTHSLTLPLLLPHHHPHQCLAHARLLLCAHQIRFFIIQNRAGKTRMAKWCVAPRVRVCACVLCTLLHCKLVLSGWCAGVQKNAGLKWCDVNDLTRAHEHLVSTCCISVHCAGLFGHELPR